jgi:hypothetical protein
MGYDRRNAPVALGSAVEDGDNSLMRASKQGILILAESKQNRIFQLYHRRRQKWKRKNAEIPRAAPVQIENGRERR